MTMKWNESFIPGLGKSGPVQAIVVGVANDVAAAVVASAPVDSGEYRSSVRVRVEYTENRVMARVVADSDHAMAVEARYGTLARALGSVASRG